MHGWAAQIGTIDRYRTHACIYMYMYIRVHARANNEIHFFDAARDRSCVKRSVDEEGGHSLVAQVSAPAAHRIRAPEEHFENEPITISPCASRGFVIRSVL